MTIETKYNITDHIWVIYKDEKSEEVCIYEDFIKEIVFDGDKTSYYGDKCPEDIGEEEIVLFNDKEGLYARIRELVENERKTS